MHPVVCMITDRRRCGAGWERALVALVGAAARAGVHLVQLRERDLDGAAMTCLARACVAAVHGTGTRVLVNDRFDVALASGAHGVHLRGDSMPASRVRAAAGRPFLIGRSVHDLDDAIREGAGGSLDYLVFGTVFDSESKPGRPPSGLGRLAAVASASRVPVLAVGGLTVGRFAEVVEAGAAGGAAISLFADAEPGLFPALMQHLVRPDRSS